MRVFLTLILAAVVSPAFAADLLYHNRGIVTNAQVDAVHFLNEGQFFVNPFTVPWDSQNTLTFTNRGLMSGNIGFRFDTVTPPFGRRTQAQSFFNSGTILAQDGGGSLPFISGDFVSAIFAPDISYVSVNSQTITNRGDVSVGAAGIIKLTSRSVDLTGGTLFVEDVNSGLSSGLGIGADVTETNFFPSAGVYDLAWGLGVDTNMFLSSFLTPSVNPNITRTPTFSITNFLGTECEEFVSFVNTNAQVWVLEFDGIGGTNRTVQVVSVSTSDPNIEVLTSFYSVVLPRGTPQGGFLSPLVEFRYSSTNFRTFELETNSLNFFSQLGSQTNWTMTENVIEPTLRPAPFVLFRSGWGLGELGFPGDTNAFRTNIFTHTITGQSYSNIISTNQFASYSAEVDSMARRLPRIPGMGVTNNPGRVEILTDDLRLRNTRIRGEGLVSLKATNVTSIQDSVIDVARLNLDLSTKSSTLRVPKLTEDFVERFGGYLVAHSAIWTNSLPHPTDTNLFIEVHFEFLSIDATRLHTQEPVTTHELNLRSTAAADGQVVFDANFAVTNLLTVNASGLTFGPESRLFLAKGIGFSYTNVINVNNFTNQGHIQLNELADFRKAETERYNSFVNHGDIIAYGIDVFTDYFENTGDLISSNSYTEVFELGFGGDGGFFSSCFGIPGFLTVNEFTEGAISIRANQAKIDDGQFFTLGDINLSGDIFKINNHQAIAGGRIFLNVTGSLSDNGIDTRNEWLVNEGFLMGGTRPSGDLLGTEITSQALPFGFITHTWAGEDRGVTAAGFTNNLALGKLSIGGDRFSTYEFLPASSGNAIYVDVLEISGVQAESLAAFRHRVILEGVNIYYGDVQSTNSAFTAETLHQIFGPGAANNFYWVRDYAGPRSGIDVPLTPTGPVARFNRALRESINADSDGDGIPNRFDPFPFPGEMFELTQPTLNTSAGTVSFSFKSKANSRYVIEYTTDLASGKWTKLKEVLPSSNPEVMLPVSDSIKAESPQRFYRVRQIEQ